MPGSHIEYRSGYKYQLADGYDVEVGIKPDQDVQSEYLELSAAGLLTIKKGYAWDGPSGPTIDTKNFMRGSLVHDALYQLLRQQLIESRWRVEVDEELRKICREDGMSKIRAAYVHRAVRKGGGPAASPEARKEVHHAPSP